MRNVFKATTLESKFPLLKVEKGCIISKDADLTIAFRVELPELFTVSKSEYEAIHSAFAKAVKVLPDYSVVHRQDWFVEEKYTSDEEAEELSFLRSSNERHFNERPFLNHFSYLFLTKTTKERARQQSSFNALTRGFIIPKEIQDKETVMKFTESVDQFQRIVNDSGLVKIIRLKDNDITGTDSKSGIVEKYFALSQEENACLQDICLKPDEMRIGDNHLCLFTLSDPDDLPGKVLTDSRYERLSTDKSDCRLSFSAPIGILLNCNHIVNQYLFIDSSADNLKKFESQARNMNSLSRYSRSNQINKIWIEEYLNDAHSQGLTSIRAHVNVMAFADNQKLKQVKNDVSGALAQMHCRPRHNTIDVPALFWAGIPGNAGDFPSEECFYSFIENALCFFISETNYKSSPSSFGIRLSDRISGRPLKIDISDLPMKRGITNNRNKFVLGPSGSGKSFFMNHLVRQYYEQDTHVLLVDTGNSYEGLCRLINRKTNGDDGIYFTYTEENPISFNPFFTEDYQFTVEKKDSIQTLLQTLWKNDTDIITKTECSELGSALSAYIEKIQSDRSTVPCFNTFYEFVRDEFRSALNERDIKVEKEDFNINNFLITLRQYYRGGRYDFLLNSDRNIDLLSKRFIVFEIDSIKDNKELFPVITVIIMEAFVNKMRRLHGIRKLLIVEEAWKALASANMADYLKYMFKTVRKHFGEVVVVTQEVDDIISSTIVKETIINNSDCKILLDQRKYMNRFDSIQSLLGLTDKEKSQILSINQANDLSRKYKEVFISLGGTRSAVYATEVSMAEYLTYTTEETEKIEVKRLAEKLDGNYELAIRQLSEEKLKVKN